MTQHPITPPTELVQQWFLGAKAMPVDQWVTDVATQAAQWGADTELEACCEWLDQKVLLQHQSDVIPELRASRRPKPPSLKEQALVALHAVATGANDMREQRQDFETIRLALEQLDG
jgi:hypothetical protein